MKSSVAYVLTKMETTMMATVSNTSAPCAWSLTDDSSNTAVSKIEPKYASMNAVFELPMKCAAKNSLNLRGVSPHTYQFPLIGIGKIGHSLSKSADLNPSGTVDSGNCDESNLRLSAANHFCSPTGSLSPHLKPNILSFNTYRARKKLTLAASVLASDVTIVPPKTPPNTTGDTTGSTKPIGKNSSVIVNFSATNNPTYTANTAATGNARN